MDFALAKGLELAGRAELEKDVAFALRTAQGEWRYTMDAELRRAVGVLLDDAVQLTAASYQAQELNDEIAAKKHQTKSSQVKSCQVKSSQEIKDSRDELEEQQGAASTAATAA